jgi:hypothetical protein
MSPSGTSTMVALQDIHVENLALLALLEGQVAFDDLADLLWGYFAAFVAHAFAHRHPVAGSVDKLHLPTAAWLFAVRQHPHIRGDAGVVEKLLLLIYSGQKKEAKGGRHMPSRSLTTEQVLTLLAETPPHLAALTAGLASAQLHTRPTPQEWSANDVLAHLRACADVWGKCIVAMIAEDMPTLRAVNPRTWIKQTDYLELEFRPSLRSFATQRAVLLAVLAPLPPEGWLRAATVTGAGKVLERNVLFYAQWLARHERPHIKQIERLVNTMPTRSSTMGL